MAVTWKPKCNCYKLNELKMKLIHHQSKENVTSENDNSHEK